MGIEADIVCGTSIGALVGAAYARGRLDALEEWVLGFDRREVIRHLDIKLLMQDRITRSRMAGDPPDIILAPRIAHIALLDFGCAEEAIHEGRSCVRRMTPALQYVKRFRDQ